MGEIKFTKTELKAQRQKLDQLQRYLPTLQLKKALLQSEVNDLRLEIVKLEKEFDSARLVVSHAGILASDKFGIDLTLLAEVEKVNKRIENIAGVEVPFYEGVEFKKVHYPLFSTPPWLDGFVENLRYMAIAKAKVVIATERKVAIEKELREVTIRVNLFEKNLIPKAERNIRKIRVFLGDQELASIAQAKVAKAKIEKLNRRRTLNAS